MKQLLIFITATLFFVTVSCAQNNKKETQEESSAVLQTNEEVGNVSYAFGVDVGRSLKSLNIDGFDVRQFAAGFEDFFKDKSKYTVEESQNMIQNFMMAIQSQKQAKNINEGKEFLEKNSKEKDVITTESGLQYKIERQGTGAYPTADDQVEVHYVGTLIDGREFDSSYKRNETATFRLKGVIAGWTEGIQKINEGGKIKLFIPYNLGYGERGSQGSIIEPFSTLIFEVELVKIVK